MTVINDVYEMPHLAAILVEGLDAEKCFHVDDNTMDEVEQFGQYNLRVQDISVTYSINAKLAFSVN